MLKFLKKLSWQFLKLMSKIEPMVVEEIENSIDKILSQFSTGDFYQSLSEAKKEYFKLTGQVTEEDDEYESRMNCFNNWYLFQRHDEDGRTIIDNFENFLGSEKIDELLIDSLKNVHHSLFEFSKVSFRKNIVLKDILHDKKIILAKEQSSIGLLEGDLFTGRTIEYKEQTYLLRGVCDLPTSVKSVLKKQCKKIRKYNNEKEEISFLLELESLKTKYLRYSHIEPSRIFTFS